MSTLGFILSVVYLVNQIHGETHFMFITVDEVVELNCGTNKWQISRNSDNRIDLNCSVQCGHDGSAEVDDDVGISSFCKTKDSQLSPGCSLEVEESGFYACVESLDAPHFFYPFKSSPNVLQSYIVAVQNRAWTLEPERRSSLNVSEGHSMTLNCSFNFSEKYKQNPFIIYWIKTVGNSSSCIYSFDLDDGYEQKFDHHCEEQERLRGRISNQTKDLSTHNITISGVMGSDSGQYRCALQMDTSVKEGKSEVKWTVIENVTVSVHNPSPPHTTDHPVTQKQPEEPGKYGGLPIGLSVAIPTLLCLLLVVVVLIRKRCFKSAGSQAAQRNQEEALDMDCSPYAVGRGDQEYGSKGDSSKTADPSHEEPSAPPELYSIVRLNSLYDSSA
ncbi:uncharacterized protein [Salminus brasiliensis]|uniref:uncharacterized protein n=1 Tax=Salminus brasiliensis TaxID=930266 RepID=UPI003B835BB7